MATSNMFDQHQLIINSLDDNLAVIDYTGKIVYVNHAWNEFGRCNDSTVNNWIGTNYFDINIDESKTEEGWSSPTELNQNFIDLMNHVVDDVQIEYPCHSPTEQRWFIMKAKRVINTDNYIVVTHINITQRKLAELKVQELTVIDPLTGLYNRRKLIETLTREHKDINRYNEPLSLLILDIDHFKIYNDTYGHLQGDKCICAIADCLKNSCRANELVYRFGGEEFIVVLPRANEEQAHQLGHRILQNVRDLQIPHITENGIVTVSIGSATTLPHELKSIEDFIAKADEALYEVKITGRNNIK
jgi:diguanylate cyclase (GGDEF)-like protein